MAEPRRARIIPGPIWTCKIGTLDPEVGELVPPGGDSPMRRAVAAEYRRLTGLDPEFIFSGWSGELTEGELAVVEERLPRPVSDDPEPMGC